MNNKALTRYKLLDDVRGEVMGVMPRLVHDFCEGYEMVDADNATREIERLEARVKEVEASMVSHFQREHLEGDGPEIDRWKAQVRDIEEVLAAEKREVAYVRQERDALKAKLDQAKSYETDVQRRLFKFDATNIEDLASQRNVLKAKLAEVERELLLKEGDNRSARSEQEWLRGWVENLQERLNYAEAKLAASEQRVAGIQKEVQRIRNNGESLSDFGKGCMAACDDMLTYLQANPTQETP